MDRDLAREAAGEPDQAPVVAGQEVLVDAGPVIKPFRVGQGDQLHEVVVALVVGREKGQVVVSLGDSGRRLVEAASRGHVDLAAQDGPEALFPAGVVEGHRPEQVAVVGDGQGLHPQAHRLVHQLVNVNGPVEQAVLGMQVEMDEVSHADLRAGGRPVRSRADRHSHSIVEGGLLLTS
jgi:hypothetical protein